MTLKGELPQWPILQLVLVVEIIDGQVLETLLFTNCLSKVLKNCVYNCGRRAHEGTTNFDILRRFCLLRHQFIDRVCSVLCEARVHRCLVQLDSALLDILGALRDDFSLVRQQGERDVVDAESKCVCHDIIENRNLPLGLAVLQLERKHALLRKFFSPYEFFGFVQADLQILSFLEVSD